MSKRESEKINLNNERSRYSSHYPLSTKLECAECGTKFRRHSQQHGESTVYIWVCMLHQKQRENCKMKPIKEQTVEEAFVQTLNELVADKERMMTNLDQSVKTIIEATPPKDIKELEKQLLAVERKMVGINNEHLQSIEDQAKTKELVDKQDLLKPEITIAQQLNGKNDLLQQRVKEIRQVIRLPYSEYRGDIFRSLVKKVIVKDKKTLRFIFKCGIEMDCQLN
ncbi:MAG: zinc ribbon domain-containing protein [Clostridiales bacterium]|nr:zinc ribbon domain-containing protein [Clostridiales bacterium]